MKQIRKIIIAVTILLFTNALFAQSNSLTSFILPDDAITIIVDANKKTPQIENILNVPKVFENGSTLKFRLKIKNYHNYWKKPFTLRVNLSHPGTGKSKPIILDPDNEIGGGDDQTGDYIEEIETGPLDLIVGTRLALFYNLVDKINWSTVYDEKMTSLKVVGPPVNPIVAPNPFYGSNFNLSFNVNSENARVSLALYSNSGSEIPVAQLMQNELIEQKGRFTYIGSERLSLLQLLSPGVYYYSLIINGVSTSGFVVKSDGGFGFPSR